MSWHRRPITPRATPDDRTRGVRTLRLALAGMLGVAAAVLVACGSSSGKLIPVADSGPLQGDFETVAQDAETGNGNCSTTETALAKTEQDFNALPASVDSGLRNTLRQGIDNLRARALALCAEPLAQTTSTSTTSKTNTSTSTSTPTVTSSATTPTTTPSVTTPTSTAPSTNPTTTSPGGGTPAGETPPGTAEQGGTGAGEGPGEGVGGAGGIGAGGQEGGK